MDEDELKDRIAEGLKLNMADATASATAEQLHQAIGNFIETGVI